MASSNEYPEVLLEKLKIVHNTPLSETIFDEVWTLKRFKKRFKLVVVKYSNTDMEIDMIGIHPFLVNAFRRILLSDVPSMAIEKVHVFNNTSIIPDEVLANRLGLIPLKADPRLFEYMPEDAKEGTEQDSLEFELKVKCSWNKESNKASDSYKNANVYSKDIKWIPIGSQGTIFTEEDVKPIEDDILIAKLRPGHELDLKLIACKGIGRDHAKFSPVATAYYRLLPEIYLTRDVLGDQAELLQRCFSPGVIEICRDPNTGEKMAEVADARYDAGSRNVHRHVELDDAVIMSKRKDYFIFTIESVGAQKPDELLIEAVNVLKSKCLRILGELNNQ